jgi:lipopolysaccharide transport system ATP-binding protein
MDSVIKVSNLGKSYKLRHEAQRHGSLREDISAAMRGFLDKPFPSARKRKESVPEEFRALKGVNFEVRRGDRLGIVGRNGVGEMLLKILSSITEPTEGRGLISGRVSSLFGLGTGFHPELSGRKIFILMAQYSA